MGKHCSNPQCFVRKATYVILNQLKIKKIKSTNNFEKNHNKKKSCREHYSNPQCFKEKNYEDKFSTSLI